MNRRSALTLHVIARLIKTLSIAASIAKMQRRAELLSLDAVANIRRVALR